MARSFPPPARPLQALLDRRRVAGEGGAADVADFVAVEVAGAVRRWTVVPYPQGGGPPGGGVDEFALGGVVGQGAEEHARVGDAPPEGRPWHDQRPWTG